MGSWWATKACHNVSGTVGYWMQPPTEEPALTEKFQGHCYFPVEYRVQQDFSAETAWISGAAGQVTHALQESCDSPATLAKDFTWLVPLGRNPVCNDGNSLGFCRRTYCFLLQASNLWHIDEGGVWDMLVVLGAVPNGLISFQRWERASGGMGQWAEVLIICWKRWSQHGLSQHWILFVL